MPEPTAPTPTVAVGGENVTVAPHPHLEHITVLSVFQGRDVPAGVAWLSPPERRALAERLDPETAEALRVRDAEVSQLRAHLDTVERALAKLLVDATDEEVRATLSPILRRPCTRCGRPVPAAKTYCDPVCPTKVVTGGGAR